MRQGISVIFPANADVAVAVAVLVGLPIPATCIRIDRILPGESFGNGLSGHCLLVIDVAVAQQAVVVHRTIAAPVMLSVAVDDGADFHAATLMPWLHPRTMRLTR